MMETARGHPVASNEFGASLIVQDIRTPPWLILREVHTYSMTQPSSFQLI